MQPSIVELIPSEGFVLIIHDVDDYPKWKMIFDAAAGIRHKAGEVEYRLFASTTHDRRIVHFSRWRSLQAARSFFESKKLVEIREEAGVHAPEFHYLRHVEQGILTQFDPHGASAIIGLDLQKA